MCIHIYFFLTMVLWEQLMMYENSFQVNKEILPHLDCEIRLGLKCQIYIDRNFKRVLQIWADQVCCELSSGINSH